MLDPSADAAARLLERGDSLRLRYGGLLAGGSTGIGFARPGATRCSRGRSLARQPAGRLVGLPRARLGWLLGLGPGRELGHHALAGAHRLHPLGHGPAAAWHAEDLEHGPHHRHLLPRGPGHLHRAERRHLVGALFRQSAIGPLLFGFLRGGRDLLGHGAALWRASLCCGQRAIRADWSRASRGSC